MKYPEDYINQIIQGDALTILKQLPDEIVNCCVSSPPYWGLRDYGIEPIIWDGVDGCEHEWISEIKEKEEFRNSGTGWLIGHNKGEKKAKVISRNEYPEYWEKKKIETQFCQTCGAWRGSLGLEPTFELYIKHLCDIFDEVKRVMRKDGTCWVNLGDTYNAGRSGGWAGGKNGISRPEIAPNQSGVNVKDIPSKSLCLIPQRFAIEMVNRGWRLRNTIIWHKPNCMPSSASDRFTVDFEYLFFFVKSSDIQFWTNEKTGLCVDKQPLGTNGIEGKDWEWRPCPACSDKNYFNIRLRDVMRKEKDCPQFKASDEEKENIKDKICPRCKGLRKIKYSFWISHDYWFEQQFEEHKRLWDESNGGNFMDIGHKKGGKIETKNTHPKGYPLPNPQGRNKRSVWTIPTQPFPEAHFATFPEKLIETPIKAGCPQYVCKKCGKGRAKIIKEATGGTKGHSWHDHSADMKKGNVKKQTGSEYNTYKRGNFKGYTDCGCNAGFESGIVLDPFMGAGTTALVALKQRKRFIGIEIKQEYIDMSHKRIAKVQQRIF